MWSLRFTIWKPLHSRFNSYLWFMVSKSSSRFFEKQLKYQSSPLLEQTSRKRTTHFCVYQSIGPRHLWSFMGPFLSDILIWTNFRKDLGNNWGNFKPAVYYIVQFQRNYFAMACNHYWEGRAHIWRFAEAQSPSHCPQQNASFNYVNIVSL